MLTVYYFRSDSGSSEDETLVRRKLGPALSVPTYPTYTQILSPRYRLLIPNLPHLHPDPLPEVQAAHS